MKIKVLDGTKIECCASAASMSYGKDLSQFTKQEKEAYVKKIWDKHYNVSEHFVKVLLITGIPRFLSMIIGSQRNITITEFSQRRRKVTESFKFKDWKLNKETSDLFEIYDNLIKGGVKLEEARDVLPISALTDLQVTLNRETARDIAMCDRAQREASKAVPWLYEMLVKERMAEKLEKLFQFDCNVENGPGVPIRKVEPYFSSQSMWHFVDYGNGLREFDTSERNKAELMSKYLNGGTFAFEMPIYSFMQFQRHRTNKISVVTIRPSNKYSQMPVSHNLIRSCDTVFCVASSLDWKNFLHLRTHNSTQEPLRTIASDLQKFFPEENIVPFG